MASETSAPYNLDDKVEEFGLSHKLAAIIGAIGEEMLVEQKPLHELAGRNRDRRREIARIEFGKGRGTGF
jgi:hypothetical protein